MEAKPAASKNNWDLGEKILPSRTKILPFLPQFLKDTVGLKQKIKHLDFCQIFQMKKKRFKLFFLISAFANKQKSHVGQVFSTKSIF